MKGTYTCISLAIEHPYHLVWDYVVSTTLENGMLIVRASVMPGGGLRRHRALALETEPGPGTVAEELARTEFLNFQSRLMATATSRAERRGGPPCRSRPRSKLIRLSHRPPGHRIAATCEANLQRTHHVIIFS